MVKNIDTNNKFCGNVAFLRYTSRLNLGFKAGKQLQNKNHTENWAQGNLCACVMFITSLTST